MPYFDSVEFVREECCNCHMVYMVTRGFYQAMNDTGARFYCPAGHGQIYKVSTLEKTKEDLELAQREAASFYENMIAAQRAQEKAEKAIRRLKKRSAAGVCPCCNRTFSQLANHMKTQHKQFQQLNGIAPQKQLTEGEVQHG